MTRPAGAPAPRPGGGGSAAGRPGGRPRRGPAAPAAGGVRRAGRARERLAEDVLRLLRFFRFHARYGTGAPDPDAMAACGEFAPRLTGLSGERVWAELGKILCGPDPGGTLRLMDRAGALAPIVPGATALARLDGIVGIEAALGLGAAAVRRLAAALEAEDADTARLARNLRMSRAEAARLTRAVKASGALIADPDPAASGRRLYRWGEEGFADGLAIAWAGGGDEAAFESAARALAAWRRPVFPVGGRDAIALGAAPGPAVGELLREVEAWWIAEGFAPDRDACLARLAAAAAS